MKQGKLRGKEYIYCIEKIYVKAKRRREIRFPLYKDTIRADNRYILRSLNVIKLELIELVRASVKEKVFSDKFIQRLKEEINIALSKNSYLQSFLKVYPHYP